MLQLCDFAETVVADESLYHYKSHGDLVDLFTNTNTTQILEQLNITESSSTIVVISATTFSPNDNTTTINSRFKQFQFQESNNLAVIVQRENILLLLKIGKGVLNCFEIIFFVILLAINLGALVWVIEFKVGNNPDFPDNVADGICAGIWYCFVTMTTVGYGDKVPKHFITRIIGVMWMLCGLLLTAVITTTIMEAVNKESSMTHKEMGVITKSFERSALRKKFPSAIPKEYNSYEEIIEALRRKDISAALVDINVAAFYLSSTEMEDIKIEKQIDVEIEITLLVYATTKAQSVCRWNDVIWQWSYEQNKEKNEDILQSTFVPSYEVNPYLVRPYDDMFNDDDGGLMMYLAILSSVILAIIVTSYVTTKVKGIQINRKLGFIKTKTPKQKEHVMEDKIEMILRKILKEERCSCSRSLKEEKNQINGHIEGNQQQYA